MELLAGEPNYLVETVSRSNADSSSWYSYVCSMNQAVVSNLTSRGYTGTPDFTLSTNV
jgi:hypothetical protein